MATPDSPRTDAAAEPGPDRRRRFAAFDRFPELQLTFTDGNLRIYVLGRERLHQGTIHVPPICPSSTHWTCGLELVAPATMPILNGFWVEPSTR